MKNEELQMKNKGHEAFNEYLIIKRFSPKTREGFTATVQRFITWLSTENIDVETVGYNDIVAYINSLKQRGNKQSSIQATVNTIKHYYNCLVSRDVVSDNPCSNISIQGIKRKTLYDTFTADEMDIIYKGYITDVPDTPQTLNTLLARKRNKVILGLIIYQGMRTEELARLRVQDIQLKEGKVFIEGSRRTQGRTLALQAHQLYGLMDYVNDTRKALLALTGKQSTLLFISCGKGEHIHNIMQGLVQQLQQQHSRIKDIQQLRASVITHWLKVYNLRKVQYMTGHRYVSSTEAYQANNMEGLIEDIRKYHPDI